MFRFLGTPARALKEGIMKRNSIKKTINRLLRVLILPIFLFFQLCYLLKTHQNPPNAEIEPAYEAGEIKPVKSPNKHSRIQSSENLKPSATSINSDKCHTLPKTNKKPISGELTTFKLIKGEPIGSVPMRDPLRLIKNFCHEDEDLYNILKDINKPNASESK